jgi:Protein of unknown function (DUF742)
VSHDGEFSADDEPLGRPFLPGSPSSPTSGASPGSRPPLIPGSAAADEPPIEVLNAGSQVRPYLLTGGRTRARGPAVAMETVVLATGAAPAWRPAAAGVERLRILQLCERPCSAAEVAARLELPLGVALVLVTDLVAEGLLDASMVAPRQADDVVFLERLIAGVAAL